MIPPVLWRVAAHWIIAIRLAGVLLPPLIGLFCVVRGWKSNRPVQGWKRTSPVVLGAVVLANWAIFVMYVANEQIGVGIEYHISRFASVLLLFSLLSVAVSTCTYAHRKSLVTANTLLLVMWFSIAFAPGHWLEREDLGSVRVNGRPVPSMVYIGDPRRSEAESIALVHVPGVGDYFVDFGEETFRETSKHEFVNLRCGAWTWKPMTSGQFRAPLPFINVNEVRIPLQDGRLVTITF